MKNRLERRKKRVERFRYIIITAMLLFTGGSWAVFHAIYQNDEKKAQAAADKFIGILEHKSYEKLGTILDQESYQALDYTLQDVKDRYDHIFNGINMQPISASNIKLKKVKNGEHKLAFQLNFTTPLGKLKNLTYHTELVKNHGRFQVKWDPSLIFPGMKGKDQVVFHEWGAERGEIIDRNENKLAANENFKWAGVVMKDLSKGDIKKKDCKPSVTNYMFPQRRSNKNCSKAG
ncbi:NTF2-like N-terminal transpeptidase domain-containing protein [Virgibacillus sp. 179-BFC.A HS]|uniref:NTF2-like N-terminal transpeptidase domain-containing protein n=1 Tax=Tigheibacillus jepli TaxID=3035914 RepID=A0ABU5CGS9_9BACI|nr:NTF2-like N-terminal transpeptidase domain-containing protein [Virgibacillus sp. 179-BFC.A HS]MDY0404768.1 NTF2-like N-terminal transpeptidase domain-containing protein [Virgibacillus sp. 179-BFC.A HS]